ncbi:MAG: hypothetical protein GX548_06115 [Lentisphaerae bacterium]|nr:hypothetical protein [Lentisphaerota bacterium]
MIERVLAATRPLRVPRGDRLPLYLCPVQTVPGDEAEIERQLKALDERGIAACATWAPGGGREKALETALRISQIQKKLGLSVGINAVSCTYTVCNGAPETAHVGADGQPFFDLSTVSWHGGPPRKLGCPFALQTRCAEIAEQTAFFCRAYKEKGIAVDFIWTDWEVDGPIEWNGGWEAAKRCKVCRGRIPGIDDFLQFQKAYRAKRSEVERTIYGSVVLEHFPGARVGNYAVYPNNGWRYWYDWFEQEPTDKAIPVKMEQRAPIRPWVDEFGPCGYTMAMPVFYTWGCIWTWYDWPNADYRWFHNLLQVASNAGQSTPATVPLVPFVHRTVIGAPPGFDPANNLSVEVYKEFLWHALLRGHDTFFLFCGDKELEAELAPLHEVWAESLAYKEFLDRGVPVGFDIPDKPGPVVSGLLLGNRLLVRRTDFEDDSGPVELKVGKKVVRVKRSKGKCQVFDLK